MSDDHRDRIMEAWIGAGIAAALCFFGTDLVGLGIGACIGLVTSPAAACLRLGDGERVGFGLGLPSALILGLGGTLLFRLVT